MIFRTFAGFCQQQLGKKLFFSGVSSTFERSVPKCPLGGVMSTLQFRKELGYPIYLKIDEEQFYPEILSHLEHLGFTPLDNEDDLKFRSDLLTTPNARILHIREASNIVARQIDEALDSDRFGKESLVAQDGYKVYRFARQAMMVFSYAALDWEMACFSDFGQNQADITDFNIIINRYLSYALAPIGVIGFWGSLKTNELFLSKKDESIGEVIYFDVYKKVIIDGEKIQKFKPRLNIVKFDHYSKREKQMRSKEELLTLLTLNTSYMDLGNNTAVRQILRTLLQFVQGVIRPTDVKTNQVVA